MKVKDLRARRHPDFDPVILDRIEGLYEGGKEWRECIEYWLPTSEIEPPALYAERKARALYEPIYPVIVNLTLGALFAEPPTVDGLDDALWARLSSDADGAKTSFSDFMRLRLADAINYQCSYVWVDTGPGTAATSRGEEKRAVSEQLKLRAIDPESVQNWIDVNGALASLLMFEEFEEPVSVVDAPVCVHRWTAFDDKEIRRWEWRSSPSNPSKRKPDDEDEAVELPAITHNYGRIPIVRMRLSSDHWLGRRLLDPATALIRVSNEHDWMLYRAMCELMVIASKDDVRAPKNGPGYWLQLRRDADGADVASYVGPSGTSIGAMATRVIEARTSLFRASQHLQLAADPTAASARQSADSKAKDWEVTEILLESYGDAILDFIREVCELIRELAGGGESTVTVGGIRGESRDPTTFLDDSAKAFDLKQASPTATAEIAKRVAAMLLGADLDAQVMQKINDEIEAFYANMANGTGAGVAPLGGAGGGTPGGVGGGGAGRPGAGGAPGRGPR